MKFRYVNVSCRALLAAVSVATSVAAFAAPTVDADKLGNVSPSPLSAQYVEGARIIGDSSPPLQAWAPTVAEMQILKAGMSKDRQKFSFSDQQFTFKSITPCRLIDTRPGGSGGAVGAGGFLGGGAFGVSETRIYTGSGKCGIQTFPGSIDSKGYVVNLFAQPVGGSSGDIEAGSSITGAAVSLVYNGGNPNYQVAGTTITTDLSGGFRIQNRFGSANIVVDVVGYFTDGDPAVTTSTPAISVFNDSGDALRISGTVGGVGAGNTANSTAASFGFKHFVVAGNFGAGGTICSGITSITTIDNAATNNNPEALLQVTGDFTGSSNANGSYSVRYLVGTCSADGIGRWTIQKFVSGSSAAHLANDKFHVMVLQPR